MKNCISCGRWFNNIIRKRLRIPGTHSETGTHRKERESQRRISRRQGRVSTWRKKDDAETQNVFWSSQGDFIYRHHVEPRVQLYVPKEESFPIPLTYIDVIRSTHRFGCSTRKTSWWPLKWRRKSKSVGFVDRFHEINTIERNSSCGLGETDKNPNDITSRSHMAWRLDKNCKSRSKNQKTRMDNRETETRTRQWFERNLFYWSEWRRIQRHHEECKAKVGDINDSCNAM